MITIDRSSWPSWFHPNIDWDLAARKMLEENPELADDDTVKVYAVTRGGGILGTCYRLSGTDGPYRVSCRIGKCLDCGHDFPGGCVCSVGGPTSSS
jgi:hypothetical protein